MLKVFLRNKYFLMYLNTMGSEWIFRINNYSKPVFYRSQYYKCWVKLMFIIVLTSIQFLQWAYLRILLKYSEMARGETFCIIF